ncbi:Nuclease-related domain-containing protein [Deinococcus reticulitermitis]|uniref:Nuclease-related domain-containing protein n=1 Tax=Deinococcus reticulitermitis TaxID=856736 RepID=A0A1H6WY12_9DEIO|nr:nuclease-related domain-containing protein [Deinococcus reticulitermitis]SEJ17690.1 Nuclease-related domain-containing protein [Deinococcus reticulitermitis]
MTRVAQPPRVVLNEDRNVRRTPGEQHLLDTLAAADLPGWTVFEQPHLNGDRPDFVLTHPLQGVVLIEVKDYDFATGRYRGVAQVRGTDGRWHTKRNPADQVRDVYSNILRLYSRKYLELEGVHGEDAWGVVETAVYFHHATSVQGAAFCGHPEHVRVLDHTHVQAIREGRLGDCGLKTLKYRRSKFAQGGQLQAFVDDLSTWLHPMAYAQERRQPIVLTPEQRAQAQPAPRIHRRLRGVAGSGKTLVLATRAANLLAAGQRVLFLSYNITLQHYVRDLIAQQTARDHWPVMKRQLVHRHYHDFVKWMAGLHDITLTPLDDETPPDEVTRILEQEWPAQLLQGLQGRQMHPDCHFDAVLIDEGQDFNRLWVQGVLRTLTANDELLIAYDTVQNLYGRDLVWIEQDTGGLGFRGRPAELKRSQRLPAVFAEIAARFQRQYIDPTYTFDPKDLPQADLFKHFVHWQNVREHDKSRFPALVLNAVDQLMSPQFNAHANDICILVDSHDLALPVIQALQRDGKEVVHVFDPQGERDPWRRREEKWRFQPGAGQIKVCSLQSFKGWEAPYLVLLLDQASHAEPLERARQIYVALTRVKRLASGGSSALLVYNRDDRFLDAAALFRAANAAQPGALQPSPRGAA